MAYRSADVNLEKGPILDLIAMTGVPQPGSPVSVRRLYDIPAFEPFQWPDCPCATSENKWPLLPIFSHSEPLCPFHGRKVRRYDEGVDEG